MSLIYNIPTGSLVQVVTDYTYERIGELSYGVTYDESHFIILQPADNNELLSIIKQPGIEIDKEYQPSIKWPTLIFIKNIKEIIILKNGKDRLSNKEKTDKKQDTPITHI